MDYYLTLISTQKTIQTWSPPKNKLKFRVQEGMLRDSLSIQVESLRLEKAKFEKGSDSIRNFAILTLKRNNRVGQKRQMSYEIVNKFYVGRLKKLDQYTRLNPIDISIDNNEIISLLTRYKKHQYRLIITSLLFSSSFTDELNVIFISCSGLNDAIKALINGKLYKMLGVINLSEIYNLENIKDDPRWVNTVFDKDIKKSDHFAFGFITDSVRGILKFSFSLLIDKVELISFTSSEQKMLVLNFKIQVIK